MNKALSKTNPYLQNLEKRRNAVKTSVCSSSAIEGIAAEKIVNDYISHKSKYPTSQNPAKSDPLHH
jgi:hypothetical protein